MSVSLFVYLFVESPITPFPRLVAGSCLRVATTTTNIIIIIIIIEVGKPSKTIDLLGSSFLIHAETSKGVNSTIGKPWNVFSGLRTCFVRVWNPLTAILFLREAAREKQDDI